MLFHAFQIHVYMVEHAQIKYMDTNALARLDIKGTIALQVCVLFLLSLTARYMSLFKTRKAKFGYTLSARCASTTTCSITQMYHYAA